jgi:hypothetical protein
LAAGPQENPVTYIITHNKGGVKMAMSIYFHLDDGDLNVKFMKGEARNIPFRVIRLIKDEREEVCIFASSAQARQIAETILAGLGDEAE